MLTIAEAKRHLFPVKEINKKGEEVERWVPGSYGITFNDGHHVSVTKKKVKIGTMEDGTEVVSSVLRVSVKAPKTPLHDRLGRIIGEEEKRKVVFPTNSWERFVEEYQRCGMPELVTQGMIQADEELEAKRAAGRAA